LLESENQQNLIYKHAISTIMPSSFVRLVKKEEEEQEGQTESATNKTQ